MLRLVVMPRTRAAGAEEEQFCREGTFQVANLRRALIVRAPYAGLIVNGTKTWELRTRTTMLRGPVGIVEARSSLLVGAAAITAVLGPLSSEDLERTHAKHSADPAALADWANGRRVYAWRLECAFRLAEPIRVTHRRGAVTWLSLSGEELRAAIAWR